jgi:hypothetical protein
MHSCIQNKIDGLLQGSRDVGLAPLLIFNQFGRLIDTRLVERLQEWLGLIKWINICPLGILRSHPYLADDDAAKANDHSFAGDLTAHHEAPALVEHLKELA